jgi:hypothetical protein
MVTNNDLESTFDHEFFRLITVSDVFIDLTPFKHTEYPFNDTSLPGADTFGAETSFLFNGCQTQQDFEELLFSRFNELMTESLSSKTKKKVLINRDELDRRIISTRYHIGAKSTISYFLVTSINDIKSWPAECNEDILQQLELGYAPSTFIAQGALKPYHILQESYFKKLEDYLYNSAKPGADFNVTSSLRSPFKLRLYSGRAPKLTLMMGTFKHNGWIDPNVEAVDFRKVFGGVPIQNRVKWIGQAKWLSYLFKYLSEKELLESTGYLWKDVACRFVDKQDKEFNSTTLRTSKDIDERSRRTIEIEVDLLLAPK